MIQDNNIGETVLTPDVMKIKSHSSQGSDSSRCWDEVHSFGDRVYDVHDSIVAIGLREFDNEIYTHNIPTGLGNRERVEFSNWLMAEVACLAVLANVTRHLGPPIVVRDQLERLPVSGVASNLGVMVLQDDAIVQIRVVGDIDLVPEIEDLILESSFR